jgi:hypothetical protein
MVDEYFLDQICFNRYSHKNLQVLLFLIYFLNLIDNKSDFAFCGGKQINKKSRDKKLNQD